MLVLESVEISKATTVETGVITGLSSRQGEITLHVVDNVGNRKTICIDAWNDSINELSNKVDKVRSRWCEYRQEEDGLT